MFRPCIDLRQGKVVQIVGGTLTDEGTHTHTNFESDKQPAWFAELYQRDGLTGGHVIALGPGNETAAREALVAWPGGLQYGGGVTADNAEAWLQAGASHVIVTSWVFSGGQLNEDRLSQLQNRVGRHRLVLDLSCRKRDGLYWVVTDRWQNFTNMIVNKQTCETLAASCAEFLVHAVDVEGLCRGIDGELVQNLARWSPIPATYAGGAQSLNDLEQVQRLGGGRIHLTIGSALDIFGGHGVRYDECVAFNKRVAATPFA